MTWIAAIPALPAIAFIALILMPGAVRNRSLWIPVGAIVASAALSIAAFFQTVPGEHGITEAVWRASWVLGTVDGAPLMLGMSLDAVTAVMLLTITLVSACVHVYSLSYMGHDARKGLYFAELSLFTSAMLLLVLADNLLLLFAAWEVMGLCSYLLIGFWFEEDEPRRASQKAFLVTRVGDLGLMFALVAIFKTCGTWDLATVLGSVGEWAPGVTVAIAIGLLLGAMGKSAQVPLHVWLPDAMAGPTPASALIHAATMVAAGVYLVARTLPIFEAAPAVQMATLIIGTVTALVAGLLACVQHDIKKVLAYSTISQLGLMFMALGAGSIVAALFHLVTHAFFKSLLFLGAGSIIHATDTQDMREMGGLRKVMPFTWGFFTIGSLALAGVVPLSGFFSKDEIVLSLQHAGQGWAVALLFVASLLTAFYMTRLYARVFEGPSKIAHAHESGRLMLAPMGLLVFATLVLGWMAPLFARFLGHEAESLPLAVALTSTVIAAAGIGLGWFMFHLRGVDTEVLKARSPLVYAAFARKFYFDAFYDAVFIRPFGVGARGLWAFDRRAIDGVVNGLASLARGTGQRLRRLQTGRLQSYQRLVLSAVVILMACVMIYVAMTGA